MKHKQKTANIQSKYTGVSYSKINNNEYWRVSFESEGMIAKKSFPFTDEGERQAAIIYDTKLIELKRDPVNILKKK